MFFKNDGLPQFEFDCHTLPPQGINYLNQILEEINDWVNKTKKVVDSFMVLPLTFGFTPLAQEFE